jgi:hypothetical protein
MKKTYRISVFNRTTGKRELMWDRYTSKKKAQEFADKMNALDVDKLIDARVFVEIR